MAQPLLPDRTANDDRRPSTTTLERAEMADLKVFWGPEICRLEYLVHLMDTGRVKDDRLMSGV